MEEKLKQEPREVIKIVLFGPESTGKTTLAKELAKHFNTNWVPEYMRTYLEAKWNAYNRSCDIEDLKAIAIGQMDHENLLCKTANRVLFCDTNLLEIKVYSQVYYQGYCDPTIAKYAEENTYDLYFLTYIDVPWEADVLRDKPFEREQMYANFKKALQDSNKPFVVLKGTLEERLTLAIRHVEKLLNKS